MSWDYSLEVLGMAFLTIRNVLIILGSWGASFLIGKMLPKHFRGSHPRKIYREEGYATIIVVLLCLVAPWISGLRPGFPGDVELRGTGIDGTEVGFRIALSICLALIAYGLPTILMLVVEKRYPDLGKSVKKFLSS